MAVREKGLGIGSTVSLQGGEFIPREYHRRILKKIAQLTKVHAVCATVLYRAVSLETRPFVERLVKFCRTRLAESASG